MPFQKRILYDPTSYSNSEILEESNHGSFFADRSMVRLLGVLHQLSYLSIHALEMFQNVAILSEDIGDRIHNLSNRTSNLYGKLPIVEKNVNSLVVDTESTKLDDRTKYLKNREMLTPSLFVKSTNFSSITMQYKICRNPPQLWRIEAYITDDCYKYYSFPGFFFQEWLRFEMYRQQLNKEERKKNKAIKKQLKAERRKQREIDTERQLSTERRNRSLLDKREKNKDNDEDVQEEKVSGDEKEISHQLKQKKEKNGKGDDEKENGKAPASTTSPTTRPELKKTNTLSKLFNFSKKETNEPTNNDELPTTSNNSENKKLEGSKRRTSALSMETISLSLLTGKFGSSKTPQGTANATANNTAFPNTLETIPERRSSNIIRPSDEDNNNNNDVNENNKGRDSRDEKSNNVRFNTTTTTTRDNNDDINDSNNNNVNTSTTNDPIAMTMMEEDNLEESLFSSINLSMIQPRNRNRGIVMNMKVGSRIVTSNQTGLNNKARPRPSSTNITNLINIRRVGLASGNDDVLSRIDGEHDHDINNNHHHKRDEKLLIEGRKTSFTSSHHTPSIKSGHTGPSIGDDSTDSKSKQRNKKHLSANSTTSSAKHKSTVSNKNKNNKLSSLHELDDINEEEDGDDEIDDKDVDEPDLDEEENIDEDLMNNVSKNKKNNKHQNDIDIDEDEINPEDEREEDDLPTNPEDDDIDIDDDEPIGDPEEDDEDMDELPEENNSDRGKVKKKNRGKNRDDASIASSSRSKQSASTIDKKILPTAPSPNTLRPGGPPPPPPPPGGAARPPPPPPPMMMKPPEPQELKIDPRSNLLNSIKTGGAMLKSVDKAHMSMQRKPEVRQNEAVAAILANRSKIAGSDSESSDSDSDYTDDDYG